MVILEVPCNIESGFGVPNGGGKLETDKFRVVFNPSNRQNIGHRSAGFSEVLPGNPAGAGEQASRDKSEWQLQVKAG